MKLEPLRLQDDVYSDDEIVSEEYVGFWRRQFRQETTQSQTIFDWLFGVIIPTICVVADPVVFKGNFFRGALLGQFRPFAYLLSFVCILAMAAWLIWGARLKWVASPVAGLFLLGSGISLLVGIVILPVSLLGLIVLVGAAGFTPLISSVVYFRNGIRAYRAAVPGLGDEVARRFALLAGLFAFVTPYVINIQISHIVSEVAQADAATVGREGLKLKYISPLVNLDPVSFRYHERAEPDEKNSPRMRELAKLYQEVTGKDIESGPGNRD